MRGPGAHLTPWRTPRQGGAAGRRLLESNPKEGPPTSARPSNRLESSTAGRPSPHRRRIPCTTPRCRVEYGFRWDGPDQPAEVRRSLRALKLLDAQLPSPLVLWHTHAFQSHGNLAAGRLLSISAVPLEIRPAGLTGTSGAFRLPNLVALKGRSSIHRHRGASGRPILGSAPNYR